MEIFCEMNLQDVYRGNNPFLHAFTFTKKPKKVQKFLTM